MCTTDAEESDVALEPATSNYAIICINEMKEKSIRSTDDDLEDVDSNMEAPPASIIPPGGKSESLPECHIVDENSQFTKANAEPEHGSGEKLEQEDNIAKNKQNNEVNAELVPEPKKDVKTENAKQSDGDLGVSEPENGSVDFHNFELECQSAEVADKSSEHGTLLEKMPTDAENCPRLSEEDLQVADTACPEHQSGKAELLSSRVDVADPPQGLTRSTPDENKGSPLVESETKGNKFPVENDFWLQQIQHKTDDKGQYLRNSR